MKHRNKGGEMAWWQIFALAMAVMIFVYMLVFLIGQLVEQSLLNPYGPKETLGSFTPPSTPTRSVAR